MATAYRVASDRGDTKPGMMCGDFSAVSPLHIGAMHEWKPPRHFAGRSDYSCPSISTAAPQNKARISPPGITRSTLADLSRAGDIAEGGHCRSVGYSRDCGRGQRC